MTNPGKFKFVAASKRARTIAASPFKDIGSIIGSDGPVEERRFFLQSLRNTLRCKDLVKHKQVLKDILHKWQLSPDNTVIASLPFPKWSELVISSLLNCADSASNLEIKAICRLLAIFFKDYGDQSCVVIPFVSLLRLLEKNPDGNAEPIFSFLSTHFSANSRCVKEELDGLLVDFDPWLRHKHTLIRRLSMESLGLLLRRQPENKLFSVICRLLCLEGSEHLLFSIIKNVEGKFTTKLQPLFKFVLSAISSCELPVSVELDVLNASGFIATAVRRCLVMMFHHCKGGMLDLEWLDPLYKDFMGKFNDADLSIVQVSTCSIAAELSVEMLAIFRNNKSFHIKDMVLVKVGSSFDAILSHYLIPLLSFANEAPSARSVLFDEISHLLVRVVRTPCDATDVLSVRFADVIDHLICFIDDTTDINHLMVLLEWRLKSDNLVHISHFLLVLSKLFESREVFHPVLVNPTITARIMECIRSSLATLTSNNDVSVSETCNLPGDGDIQGFHHTLSIMFGCLKGLHSISWMRSKMKVASMSLDKELLECIVKTCIGAFKIISDCRLIIEILLQCLYLMDPCDRSIWMESLVDVLKDNPPLLLNHRLLDYITLNFSQPMLPLSHHLITMLPNVRCLFRRSCLRFFLACFGDKGIGSTSLQTLLDMESLEANLDNERRKSLLLMKCVETLDLGRVGTEEQEAMISVIYKTFLSQYFMKFAPLWQATSEAFDKLVLNLVNVLTGKMASFRNTLLMSMWNECFRLLDVSDVKQPDTTDTLPSFVLPFLDDCNDESTDKVTMQRELLRLLTRIISHMSNKEACLRMMMSYTHAQMMDGSKEAYRKEALATSSTLLQKYKLGEGADALINVCLRDGIRSNDPTIRESCLLIIATKYTGIDLNRLKVIATGTDQHITSEEGGLSYDHLKDIESRELCIGIELRMLCPRILQYSKQLHGRSIFEYLSPLEPRYLSLLIAEFLPVSSTSLFSTDTVDDTFRLMVERLGFNDSASGKPPLQRGIRTLCVMVKRLKKNLHTQALPLLEFCCDLIFACLQEQPVTSKSDLDTLLEDCNVGSVVNMTITLLIDLVTTFDTLFQSFLEILSKHTVLMKVLMEKHREILPFIECLTARTDYIEYVCQTVLSDALPYLFKQTTIPQVVSIIENIYCQHSSHTGGDLSLSDTMSSLLVSKSPEVLECIKEYKPVASHIIKGVLSLPVGDDLRHMCLSILLNNLPNVKALSLHKTTNDTRRYDILKGLRYLLECLNLCAPLLKPGDVSSINTIWDFVNECLFYIGDVECRRMACSLLSALPVYDAGLELICNYLLSMNTTNSGSMDAKIDFDLNCNHLSSLCDDLKGSTTSAKVLYTALLHSLFILLCGHKDPGVRRCVLNFTFVVMDIISTSLSSASISEPLNYPNIFANCEYMDTSITPFVILLFKGIFPFIQRCMSGLHIRGSLFTVSIELLEQFSRRFSGDVRVKTFFSTRLHGDLLCNDEIVECLSNLRGVQKYNRNQGLKQLHELLRRDDVFSPHTTYRLLIPLCIQFMLQSEAPNYALFRETSRDCLVACAGKLSPSTLFKFLRLLVDAYQSYKISTALEVFSSIVQGIPISSDTEMSSLLSVDVNYERSQLLVQKFRRMLMRSQPNGDDLACPDVFEALGALLRHYSEDICEREIIKHSRLIGKSLCSRSRAARRYARLSIIKFLKCMGLRFFPLVLKELASALTRGFQLQVLIFTTHSMLSSLFKSDPSLKLSCSHGLGYMVHMITNELLMRQERGDNKSKIDEGRFPKALTLIELLGKFGDTGVCLSICSYLWSLLKGTCKMPSDGTFEYSNKFLHTVGHLISSSIRGFTANRDVDLYLLGNSLFYGYLSYVRGMSSRIEKQLPPNIAMQYKTWAKIAHNSLKSEGLDLHETANGTDCLTDKNSVNTKREKYYTLYPGASTGRSMSTRKKSGFDDPIIAPLFVNAALRLYNHLLSDQGSVFHNNTNDFSSNSEDVTKSSDCDLSASVVPSEATAFGILLCFIGEDVKLQRSSATCMIHLCDNNNGFIKLCGSHLADHLIERLGAMHLVGSEDLAKDHLRLACMLLRSNSSAFLFNAWKKSGKSNELIDGLLLQIEANLDRPYLQVPLLKLFVVLLQMEVSSTRQSKSLYEVFNEIFVRMLKGTLTPAALRASARAVAQFLSLTPMDESNRSKRFGMLLKHLTSSNGVVRLTVLQCIHHLLKGLSKKGAWKRYSEMVAVAIAMQLVTESDLQCKRYMATIIALIWVEGSSDHKKEFLECVAHFLTKSSVSKDAVFAYVLFHCVSKETSMSWLRKSLVLDICIPFLGALDNVDTTTPPSGNAMWQFQYYWLRSLLHLLGLSKQLEFLTLSDDPSQHTDDPTTIVLNKLWRYTVTIGINSNHPWVRGASIRVLSHVLCNASAYDRFCADYRGDVYALAKPCLKLLSTESSMIERHEKVGIAVKDCIFVLMDQILRRANKGDNTVSRFVSKLCYSLRIDLGKPRHCYRRIDILLSVLERFASDSHVFQKFLRATMLRVIIALTRATTCKVYYRIPKADLEMSEESESTASSVSISELGYKIMSTIEAGFNAIKEGDEFLKLLGFARDFVLRRKMLKRSKIQSAGAVKTKSEKKKSKKRKRRHQNFK